MSREGSKLKASILCGICPDVRCRSKLYFPNFDSIVHCTHCGQRHDRSSLQSVQEVSYLDARFNDMIRNIVMSNIIPKRGTETVKVLGLSNYHCKLLSPLLTKYGMDKRTGKARLLTEMNQGDIFDCGLFGDRAFLIDSEHIPVPGFGRDVTGSMNYLSQTLDLIKRMNNNEERLIPIHADGDGHCLVHAVSRALVGRELFWHPLRCSLKKHFQDNLDTYKDLFKDFVDEVDWQYIINECDPNFVPLDGEILGLRNIHVFGLANVLKRPIILLDSLECMNSLGDYAALFLPSLISPDLCRGKDKRLHKPLCIAWSSSGHNHYIPLVAIKKKPLPVLPAGLLPKAWGVPQSQIFQYMEFQEGNFCTIGGDRFLGDPYILRLVSSMEDLFLDKYGVHPGLVSDVHHFQYQSPGVVLADREMVIRNTKRAVDDGRLYRCLNCDAICEQVIKPQWFHPGGVLYNMASLQYGKFIPGQLYPFPLHGIVCRFDGEKNELLPDLNRSCLESCTWCNGNNTLRKVRSDGSVIYRNEDKTKTPSNSSTCSCGFKHYWHGKEYDNPPQKLNVTLDWNNQTVKDTVLWFEKESDPSLNSNAYQIALEIVQKHFPGEFGSERLVQRVVEQLLNQTKSKESAHQVANISQEGNLEHDVLPASKIILGGTGVLHKEELGMSETERQILQRVQENAETQQKRHVEEIQEPELPSKTMQEVDTDTDNSIADDTSSQLEVPLKTEISDKFVRVVTSDGRQAKLLLGSEGINYGKLKSWISSEFQIPPESQRIKYGFPPQELQSSSNEEILALSHGDRIIVEMIMEIRKSPSPPLSTGAWPPVKDSPFGTANSVAEHCMKIIETLKSNKKTEMDDLFLSMTASISNQIVWNYAIKYPHLFKQGGVFYSQFASDIGLRDKKHCNLKSFPGKTFCYNANNDSLELCVEPYGHFSIGEDIDERVSKAERGYNKFSSPGCQTKATSCPSSALSAAPPLGSMGFRVGSESKDTGQESDKPTPFLQHSTIRKGPGYSVLGPTKPSPEVQVDKLQTLANQLTGTAKKGNQISESTISIPAKCGDSNADQQAILSFTSDNSFVSHTSENTNAPSQETIIGGSGDGLANVERIPEDTPVLEPHLSNCDNSDMDCM